MSLIKNCVAFFYKRRDASRASASVVKEGKELSATARTGLWGEHVAAQFLESQGMEIVGRRVKVLRDEIDLIAIVQIRDREMLVLVEVKTRASDRYGGGRAAMDARKRHALCRAAANYLRRRAKAPFRFDLVEVIGREAAATPPVIRHFDNAFPMEKRYLHGALHRRKR